MNVRGRSYLWIQVYQKLYLCSSHRVHPNLFSRVEIERGAALCNPDTLPLCCDDAYVSAELREDRRTGGRGAGLWDD